MQQNIVEQLLRGSENIDRMRREIKQTICIIFSLAFGILRWKNRTEVFGPLGDIRWKYAAYQVRSSDEWHYSFACPGDGEYLYHCSFSGRPGSSSEFMETHPSLEKVQKVYESLPVLIEGLLQKFPQLSNDIQPLLNAADQFSPTK